MNLFLRWQVETGIHFSEFLHFDSSDDDPGGGAFLGGYLSLLYGWRYFKFGPRLLIGQFAGSRRSEFGINFSPVIARVVFSW